VTSDRNVDAFRSVTTSLRRDAAVLIFPEGISHDDPTIAPLRSGAARMALQAYAEGVVGIRLLAMGLIFEQKERPNSDVLVRVGEPLVIESWLAEHGEDANALTQTIEGQLRAVTLNFATAERAARAVRLARILYALAVEPGSVARPRSLDVEAALARRIDRATSSLTDASPEVIDAADRLVTRLDALEHELGRLGIGLEDVRISTRWTAGTRFLLREAPILLLAVLSFAFGWVTHWIPLRVARTLALRSLREDSSRDQPAMRTIIYGLAAIVAWYVIQLIVLSQFIGLPTALGWLALIFTAAHVLRLRGGRLRRALRRARTFLVLRSDRALQRRLVTEIDALVAQALSLEQALSTEPSVRP
jgi:glycerol-3-phosphate O-acyltransferase/dihydroxyacetone phosphate acyltransferase